MTVVAATSGMMMMTTSTAAYAQEQQPNESTSPVTQYSQMVTGPERGDSNAAYECSLARMEQTGNFCLVEPLPNTIQAPDENTGAANFNCSANGAAGQSNR